MYKTIIKKIGSLFFIVNCLTIFPAEKPSHTTAAPSYSVQWLIAGSAAALIIGKLSHDYYQIHHLNAQHIINNCQPIYKKIYQDIQNYQNLYQSDAQISDWDLKEIIVYNNSKPYPFKTYYMALTKASLTLRKHRTILSTQLTEINTCKKLLNATKKSPTTTRLKEEFLMLEIEGNQLYQQITRTISVISLLKIRIKLYKEYNDDCYYWEQKKQSKETGNV